MPLYDTLGEEALEYICNQTEMQLMIIDIRKMGQVLKIAEKVPKLKALVIMDDADPESAELKEARDKGINVLTMGKVESDGAENKDFVRTPPKPEDIHTISYTSGTTGVPKGVLLSHGALMAAIASLLYLAGLNKLQLNPSPDCDLREGVEVHLSFLPLAHIYERAISNLCFAIGASIGFYQGDTLKLLNDLETLRPTFFAAVPRLFNRIHDKVIAGVEAKGGIAKWLFTQALATKIANYRSNGVLTHWLWDRLVFAAVKAKLGGRVKFMVTGAAPLSPEVHDFVRVVFGVEVLEGYGMTETCAMSTMLRAGDGTHGTVGVPMPCAEVKLVDIPEMGYTSKDDPYPRGEVWVRTTSAFTGYYKNSEATAETLKEYGWVATGDVGMFDAQGRLHVIDRKKALFKLAQGEYISPEKIEATITRTPLIAQAYVEGNSLKSCLVAVVIPDQETVMPWAKTKEIAGSFEEVCANKCLKEAIMKDIKKLGSAGTGELKGFELPRDIHIDTELFTPENEITTPTFKLKRPQAKAKYAAAIDEMYSKIAE